jgi:hypothetical protein
MTERLIYHLFADDGVESEFLTPWGRVVRLGLDVRDTNGSEPVKADVRQLPLRETADLVVAHPPCHKWAMATANARKAGHEYDNLIPLARDVCREYGRDYILENVPDAPLDAPVVLNGRMFGLPIEMERAFETSFHVERPPRERQLTEPVIWYREYADYPTEWWQTVKGVRNDYRKDPLIKSGIPRPYFTHLLDAWYRECLQ